MLNRGVVIVRPRQPYIDWAVSLDDSDIIPERDGECTVYLIPEYEDEVDAVKVLADAYAMIFEEELNGWHTDPDAWPKNRTFFMFREWFDFEFHSVILDLCDYPVKDDESEI